MEKRNQKEDEPKSSFAGTSSVMEFLISYNVGSKKMDKNKFKDVENCLRRSAEENGLSRETLKSLCESIIFTNRYGLLTRKKLLFCCVPESEEQFPYSVIPIAVSTATLPESNASWQLCILQWIGGLLEYRVIDKTHTLLHICYTALFNLLQNTLLTGTVVKILYEITRVDDVTPHRVQILTRLEKKIGYRDYVPALLRIYKLFRPDLIVFRWEKVRAFPATPKFLKNLLSIARERMGANIQGVDVIEDIWPNLGVSRKMNPFHEQEVLPQPEILIYSETIEEKKKTKISVLQYRSIKDMIENLDQWEDWQWPNNPACLLRKPAALVLFKLQDPSIKIAISNWLEIAMREEVIEGVGSPARQEKLLDVCIALLKYSETSVPAVFYFLVEFLTKWDKYTHLSRVLQIISYMPFISPSSFFECTISNISHLLTTCSVSKICEIVKVLSNTAVTWALQGQTEKHFYRSAEDYPYHFDDVSTLEGMLFLTKRIERIFPYLLLQHSEEKSRLINAFLSYYIEVNDVCDELNLPLALAPSAEMVLEIVLNSDLVSIHRLGRHLSKLKGFMERVKSCKTSQKVVQAMTFSQVKNINFTVAMYLDTLFLSKAFNENWWKVLSSFVSKSLSEKICSTTEMKLVGSVCRSLNSISLTSQYLSQFGNFFEDKSSCKNVTKYVVVKLSELGLKGLEECAVTFISKQGIE